MSKKQITLEQRQEILERLEVESASRVAEEFGVSASTVYNVRSKARTSPVGNQTPKRQQAQQEFKILEEEYCNIKLQLEDQAELIDEITMLRAQNRDMLNINCLYTKIITKLVEH